MSRKPKWNEKGVRSLQVPKMGRSELLYKQTKCILRSPEFSNPSLLTLFLTPPPSFPPSLTEVPGTLGITPGGSSVFAYLFLLVQVLH